MSRNEEVEAWYKAHASNIKKWANKRSKQDAEDILQDTAIRLLTTKTEWKNISLRSATKWAMGNYYRGEVVYSELEDYPVPEKILENCINRKSVEIIRSLVDTLNGATKDIFVMHFFQELNYLEIAEELDMPYASVKQLGSRAKKIIVSKFEEIVDGSN